MHSNNDLIGQCLSNDRQIFNEHVFFNGGGERRGTNGWFPALSAGWGYWRVDGTTMLDDTEAKISKFRSLFELDEASSSKVNSITTLCFLSGL